MTTVMSQPPTKDEGDEEDEEQGEEFEFEDSAEEEKPLEDAKEEEKPLEDAKLVSSDWDLSGRVSKKEKGVLLETESSDAQLLSSSSSSLSAGPESITNRDGASFANTGGLVSGPPCSLNLLQKRKDMHQSIPAVFFVNYKSPFPYFILWACGSGAKRGSFISPSWLKI